MAKLVNVSGCTHPEKKADLIFVHGLNGDAKSAWQQSGKPETFWPDWLGEEFPDAGVWSLNYDSNALVWKGDTMPLYDRANNVLNLFEQVGIGTHPIGFICHSLGGLLVKQLLRNAKDSKNQAWQSVLGNSRFILFLSTPHSGSSMANWLQYMGTLLRTSVSVRELEAHHPQLRQLNIWYRDNVADLGIKTFVYCEERKTGRIFWNFGGILVVDKSSADPGIPGVTPIVLDKDHISICKPESKDDQVYRQVISMTKELFNDGFSNNPTDNQTIFKQQIDRYLTTPPFIPSVFDAREEDLTHIHQKLFTDSSPNALLLVNGEGGIGKTSVAAKYWQQFEADYQHLAWLFFSGSLQETLLNLALPLQLTFPDTLPGEERLNLLMQKFVNLPKPCLLVLDNINDIDQLKQHYLALRSLTNCHILLTSRITQFEHTAFYKINPLPDSVALAVFKRHYPKHNKEEDDLLRSIFAAVGGNTLVMELLAKNLAAINIDEINYTLAELLQELQQKGLLQLSQTEEVTIASKGKNPILAKAKPTDILMALYSDLEMIVPLTEDEQYILTNLSLLPAEGLAYDLMKELLTPEDSNIFSRILTSLTQRGWLEKTQQDGKSFYKISPVVQDITLTKNQDKLHEHSSELVNNLFKKLSFDSGTVQLPKIGYKNVVLYIRFAETFLNKLEQYKCYSTELNDSIGLYFRITGNLDSAKKYFYKAYLGANNFSKNYPEDFNNNKYMMINSERLASIEMALGNFKEALTWYQECDHLIKKIYDVQRLDIAAKKDVAVVWQNLGKVYMELEQLDDALKYFDSFYQLFIEFRKAKVDDSELKNYLAVACQYLGYVEMKREQPVEALIWFKDFNQLEIELHEANPDNLEYKYLLAISYHLLADFNFKLGIIENTSELVHEFYRLVDELYESNPEHIEFKRQLAIAYQDLGRLAHIEGRFTDELDWYQRFNQIARELHEINPMHVEFKRGYALSLLALGKVYSRLNDNNLARNCLENSKLLFEQLHQYSPGHVEFKNNLEEVTLGLNYL